MRKEKSDNKDVNLNELIQELIEEVKYGNITLIIQDGKVIQIDKTEKLRL